ncbi:hypothetical protein [Nocardia sp. CY41]|uniref:hypothetical protein n=1 Tax=Nocardia sp. CY41 TaxID=2608686 RepID=UPI00135748CE|nr:hypothetical protein [Nocardia sp. CY41]
MSVLKLFNRQPKPEPIQVSRQLTRPGKADTMADWRAILAECADLPDDATIDLKRWWSTKTPERTRITIDASYIP